MHYLMLLETWGDAHRSISFLILAIFLSIGGYQESKRSLTSAIFTWFYALSFFVIAAVGFAMFIGVGSSLSVRLLVAVFTLITAIAVLGIYLVIRWRKNK